MGDSSDSKKSSIPAWQRPATPSDVDDPPNSKSDTSSSPPPPPSDPPPPSPRNSLIEQASKFLQDDSIKDAPTDRKISFLESKGLQNDEIQSLLGISRNLEASSASQTKSDISTSATTEKQPEPPITSQSSFAATTSSSPPSSTSTSSPPTNPQQLQQQQQQQPCDIPPVITYPEFLLQAQKPPPLITAHRLLYTLYLTGGLAAIFYGTSKYLVAPMLESLTSFRHELSETALRSLQKLNEKLAANVSKMPPIPSTSSRPTQQGAATAAVASGPEEEEDIESITSDPTELFHRDIATQTTPTMTQHPSPSPRRNSGGTSPAPTAPSKNDEAIRHTQQLTIIHSHLSEFLETEKAGSDVFVQDKDAVAELQNYLDMLTYSSVNSGYLNGVYGTMYGANGGSEGNGGQGQKSEDDAITKFKAEIRGVKGALLSARNFPSSGAGKVR